MKLSSNYLLEIINQVFAVLVPLITLPYVAKVLGANLVGINSYTFSIATLFGVVALLGMNVYGSRAIAAARYDRDRVNRTFWSIFIIKASSTIMCLVAYASFVHISDFEPKAILWIQLINVVAVGLDVTWLFTGFEDFYRITFRNILVRICGLAALLLFVDAPSDFITFLFIAPLATLAGHLALFPRIFSHVSAPRFSKKDILLHLMPALAILVSQIAVHLYITFDKVMVGWFAGKDQVGLYDYSQKIARISSVIIGALGTVMLPRMSSLWSQQRKEEFTHYIGRSILFNAFISFPVAMGLVAISDALVAVFLPAEFHVVALLLKLLSPCIILWSVNNIASFQVLIPAERENRLTQSVVFGAIISICLNALMIPWIGIVGAVLASVMTELVVTCLLTYFALKIVHVGTPMRDAGACLVASLIMLAVLKVVHTLCLSPLMSLVLQLVVGTIVYLVACRVFHVTMLASLVSEAKLILSRRFQ